MMPGGRGMNPKMLQQMMKQLGIQVEDLDDVERVVIQTRTKEYVFDGPTVSAMKAQGQTTWQIQGEHQERPRGASGEGATGVAGILPAGAAEEAEAEPGPLFTDEDVKLVMQAAGVDAAKARAALEEAEGEVATAIMSLTEGS